MKTMTHRGYSAHIRYSEEDEAFVGHVAGIRDVVGFHGQSVADLRAAFRDAVDAYLADCAEIGREPNKPYSGNMMLRVAPEVHAAAARAADAAGKSMNQWAEEVMASAAA